MKYILSAILAFGVVSGAQAAQQQVEGQPEPVELTATSMDSVTAGGLFGSGLFTNNLVNVGDVNVQPHTNVQPQTNVHVSPINTNILGGKGIGGIGVLNFH